MTGRLETWPSQCTQLYLPDSNGDTLYYHTLPLGEGNLTMGIFADSSCTQVSNTTTFYDYVIMYYSNYYYGSDYGTQQAENWQGYIEQWNEAMSTWKVCQPCRAYSISQNSDNDNHNDGRFLENNDGEGDEEQWGYNCYDDAGYTNVNQVSSKYVSCIVMNPVQLTCCPPAARYSVINLKSRQTCLLPTRATWLEHPSKVPY